MSAIFNLLDRLPPGQVVQLRDPHGEILWEGEPVDGEIRASLAYTGVIASLNLPDGQTLYAFVGREMRAGHKGDSWTWRPDFTLSPYMLNVCSIILTVVCVIWAKVTYG
jgi:hypothetical protein